MTGPDPREDRFPDWLEDSEHDYFAPTGRLGMIAAVLLYGTALALLTVIEACRCACAAFAGRGRP